MLRLKKTTRYVNIGSDDRQSCHRLSTYSGTKSDYSSTKVHFCTFFKNLERTGTYFIRVKLIM